MIDAELISAQEKNRQCLMVVLHGLGDSMEGYRWLPEQLRLPWLNYLLVNAPDDYYGGFSWYDIGENAAPGVVRSYDLLRVLFDDLRTKGFPTNETTVFGFSQGCLMTIEVGMRYPERFAGLVGVSGYVHAPEKLIAEMSPVARQQKFLFTHGTQDPLIPLPPVRAQMDLLRKAGIQFEWREFDKVHTIAGEKELSVIRNFVESCYARA